MTAAQNMNPKLRILIPVVRGLAKILGKDYEVNLHDVSIPERSLVLCENGYVTGRSEGGPMTDFGLLMLQSEEYQSREGVFNYLAKNNRGELIKCSCIFIRDENDKIIGFLCINYDLKKAVAAQELIEGLLRVEMSGAGVEPAEEPGARFPEPVRESFAQDIDEVVGDSLAQVKRRIGKLQISHEAREKRGRARAARQGLLPAQGLGRHTRRRDGQYEIYNLFLHQRDTKKGLASLSPFISKLRRRNSRERQSL